MPKFAYVRFLADGRLEGWQSEEQFPLGAMQALCGGGNIQTVPLQFWQDDPKIREHVPKDAKATIYCNEEGKLKDMPVNKHFKPYHLDASQTITGEPWDDVVVGPALMEIEL